MPLTLRDLVATPELGLRLLTHGADVDRPITWVHVSELDDPTPFLTGGELLLTTGIADGSGAAGGPDKLSETDDYVRRLGSADVVGLGFGTGLSHTQVPVSLLAAAARHGLPMVEVPRATPFIAISRAVSRSVAADEYAAVTRTFTAQQALTKAALSTAGPDRLVRLLSQQVGGWVVLLDAAGMSMAAHPEAGATRLSALASEVALLAAHRGAVSSGFGAGDDSVSLQSVGTGQRGRAFLAVGRPGTLTAADRHLVNAAVMLLTIRLEQSRSTDASLRRLRSVLVRLVLSGQTELAQSIAQDPFIALPPAPVVVLVAVDLAGGGLADPEVAAPGPLLAAELDDTLVVILGADRQAASNYAARWAATSDLAAGLSEPTGYQDIAAAHRRAGRAADFGRRHGRPVTTFEQISTTGLTGILDPAEAMAFAESLLRPLVEHDMVGRGDLVRSLRTWLAHHGQRDPSSAALGVHRHTMRHRMRTVEELLGRSLDAPGTRAELWLALDVLDSQ